MAGPWTASTGMSPTPTTRSTTWAKSWKRKTGNSDLYEDEDAEDEDDSDDETEADDDDVTTPM